MILLRSILFAAVARAIPGIERDRIWNRLDLEVPRRGETLLEIRLARRIAPWHRTMAAAMMAFFVAGVALVWGVAPALLGAPTVAVVVPLVLGVLVHGLFILMVHECTHGNVLGRPWDDWIGNAAIGMLLLPFLAERYQMVHRVHHQRANQAGDTNWTPFRQRLFRRSRWLYALYELLPIVNNLDRIRDEVRPGKRSRVLFAWLCAAATYAVFQPPLLHWVLVVLGVNTINALRLWVEHFGHYRGRVSNTYFCPLGFGIGNHEIHHRHPRIPALVLALGLALRRKDASVLTGVRDLLSDERYAHFRTFQADFTGDNV
jgi:fatty acid desaturase